MLLRYYAKIVLSGITWNLFPNWLYITLCILLFFIQFYSLSSLILTWAPEGWCLWTVPICPLALWLLRGVWPREGINWSCVRSGGIYYLDLLSARSQGTECISSLKATSLSWLFPDTPTLLNLLTASSPCPCRPQEVRLQPLPAQGTALFPASFPNSPLRTPLLLTCLELPSLSVLSVLWLLTDTYTHI